MCPRRFERDTVMVAKGHADQSSGPAEPSIRRQQAVDMTAPETFAKPHEPLTRGAVQTGHLHISRKSAPKIRSMTVLSEGCSSAHYHRLLVATVEAEPLIAAPAAVDCARLVTASRGLSAEIRRGCSVCTATSLPIPL